MKIIIGTRASRLAMAQTEWAADLIRRAAPGAEVELRPITTAGDANRHTPLDRLGVQGIFTSAIEAALLEGSVDLAVHSMKDLPAQTDGRLEIICVPQREDPRDALVLREAQSLSDLPAGARIGTGSRRRACQLRALRADLRILPIRGNIDTRLRAAQDGGLDGVVLAAAGLLRLGLGERITELLPPEQMLPACGQGALALQALGSREDLRELLAPLEDSAARRCVQAERAFLRGVGGGCHSPVGALCVPQGGALRLRGLYGDDERFQTGEECGAEPRTLGESLAGRLRREWEAME